MRQEKSRIGLYVSEVLRLSGKMTRECQRECKVAAFSVPEAMQKALYQRMEYQRMEYQRMKL